MSARLKSAFYQELSLMWRFRDHPSFVSFVLKHYTGEDLRAFIRGRNRANTMFNYCMPLIMYLNHQITDSVSFMHLNCIIHRDLKPGNIFLEIKHDGTMAAILGDLGISQIVETGSSNIVASFVISELRGASLSYAAPEFIQRLKISKIGNDFIVWKAGDAYH